MKEPLIKFYFYIEKGLDILNTFRNLFLAIFAAYIALQFTNILIAIGMFIISFPVLSLIGYYNVHYISKVRDKLSIGYGTHYGIKQFDYTKRIMEILEEIEKKL